MKRPPLLAALLLAAACGQPPRSAPAGPQATGPFERVAYDLAGAAIVKSPDASGSQPLVSLTSSDGRGLALVGYRAKAVAEGPLAFTELHLAFRNPEPRVVEGTFRVALPPGASISRFAMRIGATYQEGEVVEREASRVAYETFLHRRVDPALLEQGAGNELTARVFPIAAGEVKELVVSYTEELPRARDPYRLRLRGLPLVEALEVELLLPAQRRVVHLSRERFTPDRDFVVAIAGGADALRHGRFAALRVTPRPAKAPEPFGGLVILFDASASRAAGWREEVRRLGELVKTFARTQGASSTIDVACFDQEVTEIWRGPAGGFGGAELSRIEARGALGASDLARALAWARTRGARRVLLATDGVVTAGDAPGALAGVRIDAVVSGSARDPAALEKLVAASPANRGTVIDAAEPPAVTVERLARRVRSIPVAVRDAVWTWPAHVDAAEAADQAVVYAELPASAALTVDAGGGPEAVRAEGGSEALLERAVHAARIRKMEQDVLGATDPGRREALRRELVALSTKHRILTRFTGFLVLETDQDYARFRIDRRAIDDVLTVGVRGVERLTRPAPPPGPPSARSGQVWGPPATAPQAGAEPRRLVVIESNEIRILQAIRFADGSARLLPESRAVLDTVIDVLWQFPHIKRIEVGGHTDNLGSREANVRLSETRARAVREAILASGIAPERIVAKGYGPDRPIAPNTSDDHRARNRRVEFRILETDAQMQGPRAPSFRRKPAVPARGAANTGPFHDVSALLTEGKRDKAVERARAFHASDPGVLSVLALGEALEAQGRAADAARAYGSLIDLSPADAPLRRHAGGRLERLSSQAGPALDLAIDSYRRALADRADHPSGHRLLAFALARAGRLEEAFRVLTSWRKSRPVIGRFPATERILAEDMGLLGAALVRAHPEKKSLVEAVLRDQSSALATAPSLRFVLTWETDASDLDLHVTDKNGAEAFHRTPTLPSGGELYGDATEGYGPEAFVIAGAARAHPYRVRAHVYRRGATGYALGKLQIVEHDGAGSLRFDERPFVVMNDGAEIDLGSVDRR
jgi:outer membrane protein OmpA-like peptidoglycan-associated protein